MTNAEHASSCTVCGDGTALGFDFSMAFQPIVDVERGCAYAYEALVRGTNGEGAGHVLAQVKSSNRYRFDQACRVRAIELAASSGIGDAQLNINFLPNAVYEPSSCIQTTLSAAREWGIPPERICLEVVESERIDDHAHVVGILEEYKRRGLVTAIDDFGAGHAGLNLLAEFQPDNLKMDMKLIRGIDQQRPRQVIVRNILNVADDLGIRVIAEGVETAEEFDTLRELGITLFQGYYFGRPAFEHCEPPFIPA